MQFLPSSDHVDIAIWMHYIDANYTYGEKSWRQLHKNAVSNIEQVVEPVPHKAAAVWPPTTITKTIQVRWTRHAGHCWRSKDKLISDVLLCTPSHGWAKAGWPAWTYIQQLCVDMRCSPEDLPKTMDDREGWRERVRDICADGATWWWLHTSLYRAIGLMSRVFTNGQGDQISIPGHVISKT